MCLVLCVVTYYDRVYTCIIVFLFQVVCDADLVFMNVVAKWPGSVHDSRILRLSPLFQAFEGIRKPVDGIILGDSAYMLRPWLMTPIRNPATRRERRFNAAHRTTRSTVERAIGVAKQRWRCLRHGLRIGPEKSCKIIIVCFMLHNYARRLKLPIPPQDSSDDSESSSSEEDSSDDDDDDQPQLQTERARVAAGRATRDRIVNTCF